MCAPCTSAERGSNGQRAADCGRLWQIELRAFAIVACLKVFVGVVLPCLLLAEVTVNITVMHANLSWPASSWDRICAVIDVDNPDKLNCLLLRCSPANTTPNKFTENLLFRTNKYNLKENQK